MMATDQPIFCRNMFVQTLPTTAILPGSIARIAGVTGIVLSSDLEDIGNGMEWSLVVYCPEKKENIVLCDQRESIEILFSLLDESTSLSMPA